MLEYSESEKPKLPLIFLGLIRLLCLKIPADIISKWNFKMGNYFGGSIIESKKSYDCYQDRNFRNRTDKVTALVF
jgi:hypothetical protein